MALSKQGPELTKQAHFIYRLDKEGAEASRLFRASWERQPGVMEWNPVAPHGKSHEKHTVSCAGPTSGAFLSGEEYCHGNTVHPFEPANSKTASQTQANKTRHGNSFFKKKKSWSYKLLWLLPPSLKPGHLGSKLKARLQVTEELTECLLK